MTLAEAKKIIKELHNGKHYITRFQEQEWGIEYLTEKKVFREWGRETDLSGRGNDKSFDKSISETEAIDLFLRYDFKRVLSGLKD